MSKSTHPVEVAKRKARLLRKALAPSHPLTHTEALEAVARLEGARDWHTYQKTHTSPELPPEQEACELSREDLAHMVAEEAGREEGKVGTEEYAAAVRHLLNVAQQPTGGGSVAAQVLLSAYNGWDFQLDVSALNSLDRENYHAAITVIRGRRERSTEPHEVVANGSAVFRELAAEWPRLHVKERHKIQCRTCEGYGRIFKNWEDEVGEECWKCHGEKWVCSCGK